MADRCLCTNPDAALCDGGGSPPCANGCDCACHGGAEATDALLRPAPAARQSPLIGRSALELAHGLAHFAGGNPEAGTARAEHADTLLSLAATEQMLAEALRVGLEECQRLRAEVVSVTAERDRARARYEILFNGCSLALLGPIALSPCGTEQELAEGIAELRAERDRLQRACDEGLPREAFCCPRCGSQHIDGPRHDNPVVDEAKRPHHEHFCPVCRHVWERGWSFGVAPDAENAITRRLRAEGRVDGLREALDYARTEEARLARACDRRGISHEDLQRLQGCRFTADEIAQAIEAMLAKGGVS